MDKVGRWFPVKRGVRQGDLLSPNICRQCFVTQLASSLTSVCTLTAYIEAILSQRQERVVGLPD